MKHILARHPGLWAQHTSQYEDNGNSQVYEEVEEFEATIQIADEVYETYNDFTQNI